MRGFSLPWEGVYVYCLGGLDDSSMGRRFDDPKKMGEAIAEALRRDPEVALKLKVALYV